jgi:hypothetical protein
MRTLPSRWLPTPPQLEQAPELGVLAALDTLLEVATCALQVALPEIDADPECPYWVAGDDRLTAESLLQLFEDLRVLLARYRDETLRPADILEDDPCHDELPCAAPSDDDIPF